MNGLNKVCPAILSLVLLPGCASYVNIPADSQKDIAINTIDAPPTPVLIGAALEYALRDYPPSSRPFAIKLPLPASDRTWSHALGTRPNSRRYDEAQPDMPVYDVRTIRIRGNDAFVDIVLPTSRDNRPVLEVHLQGGISGWTVVSARRWGTSVLKEEIRPLPENDEPVSYEHTNPDRYSTLTPIRVHSDTSIAASTTTAEPSATQSSTAPERPESQPLVPIRVHKPDDDAPHR